MTQELAKFNETLSSAPAILQTSTDRVEKAKAFGLQLLAKIESEGMNDTLDQEANNYLVKVKKTGELIHTARTPITQLLDQVKKNFTALEAEISPKTQGGVYSQVQSHRDEFAKEKLEAQRKKEAEAKRKQAIADEKVSIKAEAETKFSEFFIEYLSSHKNEMNVAFNNVTLEDFDQVKQKISEWTEEYPDNHVKHFTFQPRSIYLNSDEVLVIRTEVINDKLTQYKADFKREISEHKKTLWDYFPSKKIELEAIAEAEKNNAEEAARLKKEKEEREKKEKERLAKEAEDKRLAEKQVAEGKKEEASMENMFNATASTAGTPTQERTGYNMVITHPAAYVQIFQLWFEGEGKNLPMDAIEKRTIKQMKSWCEKIAHKAETMIKSPYVKYEEVVTTRAKA